MYNQYNVIKELKKKKIKSGIDQFGFYLCDLYFNCIATTNFRYFSNVFTYILDILVTT